VSKQKATMSLMSKKIELKSYNILSKPACALRLRLGVVAVFCIPSADN